MKTLEKMKSMMMALMCALALVGFNSCSDDDDEEPTGTEQKAAGYYFVMEFTPVEDSDHKDLINTTYTYTMTNGEVKEKTVPEQFSTKETSQTYTKLPGDLLVVVKETLKDNVKLDKESYKMGIGIKFTVYSVDKDKNVIDFKGSDITHTFPLAAEHLKDYYPDVTTFDYYIDEKGKISEMK